MIEAWSILNNTRTTEATSNYAALTACIIITAMHVMNIFLANKRILAVYLPAVYLEHASTVTMDILRG